MRLSEDKKELLYPVGSNDQGKRLDVVARKVLVFLPLSQIFSEIRKGNIRVNGQKATQNQRLYLDDTLSYRSKTPLTHEATTPAREASPPVSGQILQQYQSLEVLWENPDWVVVNKPIGWISHGDQPSLTHWLVWKYGQQSSLSFAMSPAHRLDVGTSGVVVLAKTVQGARLFAQQQEQLQLTKIYLALVHGHLAEPSHTTLYLSRKNKKSFIHTISQSDAKEVITSFYPLQHSQHYTLVACKITHGRTHQIRAVAAHLHHPLVGDTLYGSTQQSTGFCLHSYALLSSMQELPEVLIAPLPESFGQRLTQLNFNASQELIRRQCARFL
jgi:RluA family pseudouridine synthase